VALWYFLSISVLPLCPSFRCAMLRESRAIEFETLYSTISYLYLLTLYLDSDWTELGITCALKEE